MVAAQENLRRKVSGCRSEESVLDQGLTCTRQRLTRSTAKKWVTDSQRESVADAEKEMTAFILSC